MIPRWIRIAYVVFGLTFVAIGISWLVKGNGYSASGGIQVAIGVGWLLLDTVRHHGPAGEEITPSDGVSQASTCK